MARFEIDFLTDYSDDSLLDELRRIAKKVPAGGKLTRTAYNQCKPRVADSTVSRRFGGWKEALERAELLNLYHGQPVTDRECYENLADVWTHFGRPPEYREMFRPPSTIQGKTYVERVGEPGEKRLRLSWTGRILMTHRQMSKRPDLT